MQKIKITPDKLVCMNEHQDSYGFRIELAYAKDAPPNIFGQIYRHDAKLWLHEDLAAIVLKAAKLCQTYRLVLYDGLRTVEAQEKMQKAPIVRAHPQWLEEPGRRLSPPGAGAHPRGMAIDLTLETPEGELLDMGTVFDFLAEESEPAHNPAHRAYQGHAPTIVRNRKLLEDLLLHAAEECGAKILLLPQEWWDFRLPPEIYERYEPLSDAALPEAVRMTYCHTPQCLCQNKYDL